MSNSINFTLIKVTLYFLLGIVLSQYITTSLNLNLLITLSALIGILLFNIITRKSLKPLLWLDIVISITVVYVGILTVQFNNPKQLKNHYSNLQRIQEDSLYVIQFKVKEQLKPSLYHQKYIVSIDLINENKTTGNLLLNIEKDSLNQSLSIDDICITKTKLMRLNSPLNPYQFNYAAYLNKKYIYHQLSIDKEEFLSIDSTKNTLVGYASKLRKNINKRLQGYDFSKDELAILNALLLGQRQDISKDIYESYTKAGAIHILAVSGLHVGIILMLLHHLFKPIEHFKKGKQIKTICIVFLLWCYAFIAGLSPSVVRAVSMFTIFAIAMNLKRPIHIYNTIAMSILFLLLVKPNFLFEVGFQMSYLAVLSIVTIEPILSKLWKPKYKLLSFFWNILTVTLAAQIGVLPISLFYFHQFPGLFFLSNLVIIPFLGMILGFGILIIVLALLNLLPTSIASIYGYVISLLNNFVNWVSLQEGFLFQNISFNIWYVIFSYTFIISVLRAFKLKTFSSISLILMLIISFQGYLFYKAYRKSESSLIVFHKSRHSIIGFQSDKTLQIYHSMHDSLIRNEAAIINYRIGENIKSVKADSLQNAYALKNKSILIIDSLGVYNLKQHKPHFILLRNSPKVNLGRLIDSLNPKLIISDGSNYRSYQDRWNATCREKKIPFHQTSKKGAFIYRY